MKGMFALLGFEQAEVTYERPARSVGAPSQRIRSLLSLALEGVISFSVAPLRIWSVIGLVTAILSALYGVIIILDVLINGRDAPGWASLITVVLFMNGLILLGLGVIGEYLSRVFTEVKQRPLYLVRDVQGSNCGAGRQPRNAQNLNSRKVIAGTAAMMTTSAAS